MDRHEFRAMRERLGLTQTQWGERIGLTLRAVQDIEGGQTAKVRLVHVKAAGMAALEIAFERQDLSLAGDVGRMIVEGFSRD